MRTLVIIPAYNEEQTIGSVLSSLAEFDYDVVVVNDGSRDGTETIVDGYDVIQLKHVLNRGLGSALVTGFTFAMRKNYDYVVTMDADGQHDVQDIGRAVAGLLQGADAVIGSRMYDATGMPWHRQIAQRVANVVTPGGHITTDSQSGFRAFRVNILRRMHFSPTTPPGMEISSQIIEALWRLKCDVREIPIKPIYTEYSLSKGQNVFVGLKTLGKLIAGRLMS